MYIFSVKKNKHHILVSFVTLSLLKIIANVTILLVILYFVTIN
jgi:hypothetical protein